MRRDKFGDWNWHIHTAAAAAKSLQSCPTLCNPTDGSPPGSSIPGILQARTVEWVSISFSNAWVKSESEVTQTCPTPSDPMDCSPPGSSVHGVFQARALEWGAIAFSYYSSLKNSFHKICLPLTSLRAHPWQMAVSSGAFFFSKSK